MPYFPCINTYEVKLTSFFNILMVSFLGISLSSLYSLFNHHNMHSNFKLASQQQIHHALMFSTFQLICFSKTLLKMMHFHCQDDELLLFFWILWSLDWCSTMTYSTNQWSHSTWLRESFHIPSSKRGSMLLCKHAHTCCLCLDLPHVCSMFVLDIHTFIVIC